MRGALTKNRVGSNEKGDANLCFHFVAKKVDAASALGSPHRFRCNGPSVPLDEGCRELQTGARRRSRQRRDIADRIVAVETDFSSRQSRMSLQWAEDRV